MTALQTTTLHQVVGKFLYYARAVNPMMLEMLNELATVQTNGTQATTQAMTHFLNYCATHPLAIIQHKAYDMILHIHSDASYLSAAKARSHASGHHFLGNKPTKPPIYNGPILNLVKIMCTIMSSAAEAKVGALSLTPKKLSHFTSPSKKWIICNPPCPSKQITPLPLVLSTTVLSSNAPKLWTCIYWVQDRVKQGQFHIYWAPGSGNLVDYFTKKHSPNHRQRMRSSYLHSTPYSCL
jgi:hypothetical protein